MLWEGSQKDGILGQGILDTAHVLQRFCYANLTAVPSAKSILCHGAETAYGFGGVSGIAALSGTEAANNIYC